MHCVTYSCLEETLQTLVAFERQPALSQTSTLQLYLIFLPDLPAFSFLGLILRPDRCHLLETGVRQPKG